MIHVTFICDTTGERVTANLQVTVFQNFEINLTAFIQSNYILGPFGQIYGGDNRDFDPFAGSFRVRQLITVAPENPSNLISSRTLGLAGITTQFSAEALADGVITPEDYVSYLIGAAPGVLVTIINDAQRISDHIVQVHLAGGISNGLLDYAPTTDWDIFVTINTTDPASPIVTASGAHDGFPSYEIYSNNIPIHQYSMFSRVNCDPTTILGSASCTSHMIPPMEIILP